MFKPLAEHIDTLHPHHRGVAVELSVHDRVVFRVKGPGREEAEFEMTTGEFATFLHRLKEGYNRHVLKVENDG